MPFFDQIFTREALDQTALVGLCDVTLNGERFENQRIRFDLVEGLVRIEAARFDSNIVILGKPPTDHFLISNVSIHSGGVHLRAATLEYSFVKSNRGLGASVYNTSITSVAGFHTRPASVSLVCNKPVELTVDVEAYERRFNVSFNFHRIALDQGIELVGSPNGYSIGGREIFHCRHIDNAAGIIVGQRHPWGIEWEGHELRIRLNSWKSEVRQTRPIINTTKGGWVCVEEASKNAVELFSSALRWFDSLERQQLTKALVGLDALLAARQNGQDYLLSMFGVFRFWEWADGSKTLSRSSLSSLLDITERDAQILVKFRNDLIHGRQLMHEAIMQCDAALRESSSRYVADFEMQQSTATLLNYIHSVSAEALMRVIGYTGPVQNYLPVSGRSVVS